MSDLISRKSVLDKLKDFSNMYTLEEEARIVLETIVRIVTEQPIAYDVSKVVAELEENIECSSTVKHRVCRQYTDCFRCLIDRAINLIRKGGVE